MKEIQQLIGLVIYLKREVLILNVESENKLWWEAFAESYLITGENEHPSDNQCYIGVKRDLSDLREVIEWCIENDNICEIISQNALHFYEKYICKEGIFEYLHTVIHKIIDKRQEEVYKVNIIVPFRDLSPDMKFEITEETQDRWKQLDKFKKHMVNNFIPKIHDKWLERGITGEIKITIVQQDFGPEDENNLWKKRFNRGLLLNIGYIENPGYDAYIFHDVDLLPSR